VKQSTAPLLTVSKPYTLTTNSSSSLHASYPSTRDGVSSSARHSVNSSGSYAHAVTAAAVVDNSAAVRVVDHKQGYQQFYEEQMNELMEKSNKKKRDRDIELQLLAGDLTALDSRPNTIKELDIDHKWDIQKYTDQQIREHEIQKGFGIGTTKSLMQVSKQQNRKHQLNSLAIKAAETELSLLEKRNHRMLTKSETQGKYGW